ncbi:hypothetical protein BU17DRAFT_46097 [Hysterangium stoloniferum]|nr:hypothetical protein BU17DRAFT_46097 [Hysterangium stoloniferum]
MPRIFLPLSKADKCSVCGNSTTLRLCSRCAECVYCSVACQKEDWPTHKKICKTDRIDLTSFHPILACIAEGVRIRPTETHVALQHKIINSPNPDSPAFRLPDGSCSRIVMLGPLNRDAEGKPVDPLHNPSQNWWTTAQSLEVLHKLMRRILREGNVIPTVTGICLAIMVSIYSTTTTENGDSHRKRLRYRSSPISDFGIANGSMEVTPEDQLAYLLPDGSIIKGQDPKNHYWIYFTTQKGEEVIFDPNMFTFNMCLMAKMSPYLPPSLSQYPSLIPVLFKDRIMNRGLAREPPPPGATPKEILTERKRFSVLRNEKVLKAFERVKCDGNGDLRIADDAMNTFISFMSTVAGRGVSKKENAYMVDTLLEGHYLINEAALDNDRWKQFPDSPTIAIETDPNENMWDYT